MSSKSRTFTPPKRAVTALFFALEFGGLAMLLAGHVPLAFELCSAALGLMAVAILARW